MIRWKTAAVLYSTFLFVLILEVCGFWNSTPYALFRLAVNPWGLTPIDVLCQFVISAIPAVLAIRLKSNIRLRRYTPEEAAGVHEWESSFKWSSYVGTFLGTAAFFVTFARHKPDAGEEGMLLVMAAAFVIGTKVLNRLMVRITHTNEQLIQGMTDGSLWDEIPEDLRTEKDIKAMIGKMKKGAVHTVEAAVEGRKMDQFMWKAAKVGAVVTFIMCGVMDHIANKIDKKISQRQAANAAREEEQRKKEKAKREEARLAAIKKQKEDEAERYAKKKDAEKRYYAARKWAIKGAAVNPNSLYTQARVNDMKYWKDQMDKLS